MDRIKRVLICLDNSPTDEFILAYSHHIFKNASLEAIYFLHVAATLDIPDEVLKKYPDLVAPVDEAARKNFTFNINRYYQTEEYTMDILEGDCTSEILKYTKRKNVDILVMGHKNGQGHSDVIQRKIAKLSHTSMLLVPETGFSANPIVVPVDFSDHSLRALQMALSLSKLINAKVIALHVYSVPSGYHKTGKSFEEFAEIIHQNSRKDYSHFITKLDSQGANIEDDYVLDENERPAEVITSYAKEKEAGLILIGSRGRTSMASLVLGSVAEKVISLNKKLPMLVVKTKDENMGLLDAILNL